MQLSIPHIIIRTLFLLIYSTVITTAYSQWYTPENVLPLARKQYDKGITMVNDQQYKNALPFIEKAIAADPKFIDAYLTYAGLQGELKNYDKCITYYKQAFALDTQYTKPYLLPYSINLAGSGNFAEALKAVNKFAKTEKLNLKSLQSAKYRARCYQFALDFAKLYPNNYTFNPINLGDNINTAESEYFPSITIDGSKLVFTRRVNDRNEDFYESNYSKSKWGKATPIKGSVNTLFNEGAQNISQDGSILFYTGCNFPQGQGSCDLYYSLYINGAYTKPIPAGNAINTEYWKANHA